MRRTPKMVDWESIRLDYRAGQLSLRELATTHGINHVSIKKRADKERWPRDLAQRIQARAVEMVSRANPRLANKANTDEEIIQTKAKEVAALRLAHRQDITRMRSLGDALLAELETQTFDAVLLEQLGELMRNPDDAGADRLNDLYKKVISTPGRVDTAKKLIETMKTVIALEREAYGINVVPESPVDGLARFIASMRRSALPIVHEVEPDDGL